LLRVVLLRVVLLRVVLLRVVLLRNGVCEVHRSGRADL
jgi:hypothetical protein